MANSVINKRIEEIIKEKGLKKKIVAEKIGLDAMQFSALLSGRRTIKDSDIVLLAKALDVNVNELFEND